MSPFLNASNKLEKQLDQNISLLQPTRNTTMQTFLTEIHRANFIWPEDPADEIPVK